MTPLQSDVPDDGLNLSDRITAETEPTSVELHLVATPMDPVTVKRVRALGGEVKRITTTSSTRFVFLPLPVENRAKVVLLFQRLLRMYGRKKTTVIFRGYGYGCPWSGSAWVDVIDIPREQEFPFEWVMGEHRRLKNAWFASQKKASPYARIAPANPPTPPPPSREDLLSLLRNVLEDAEEYGHLPAPRLAAIRQALGLPPAP